MPRESDTGYESSLYAMLKKSGFCQLYISIWSQGRKPVCAPQMVERWGSPSIQFWIFGMLSYLAITSLPCLTITCWSNSLLLPRGLPNALNRAFGSRASNSHFEKRILIVEPGFRTKPSSTFRGRLSWLPFLLCLAQPIEPMKARNCFISFDFVQPSPFGGSGLIPPRLMLDIPFLLLL